MFKLIARYKEAANKFDIRCLCSDEQWYCSRYWPRSGSRTRPAWLRSGLRRWECESPHLAETPAQLADRGRQRRSGADKIDQKPRRPRDTAATPAAKLLKIVHISVSLTTPHMIPAPGPLGDLGTGSLECLWGHVCVVCGGLSVVKLFLINWEWLKYNQTLNILPHPMMTGGWSESDPHWTVLNEGDTFYTDSQTPVARYKPFETHKQLYGIFIFISITLNLPINTV